MKTTTDKLLAELNAKLGLTYPMVGYSYFADVKGDGSNRKSIWFIINRNGGVCHSYLNAATPRKRCDKIRAAIAENKEQSK